MTLQSVLRDGGLCVALALPLFLAGCGTQLAYTDPNIPASQRYFNTAGSQPILATGAQPAHATGSQPVNPTAVQPVGITAAQPVNPSAVQPGNAAATPPKPADGGSPAPFLPGGATSSKLGVGDLLTISFSDVPITLASGLPQEQQQRIGDDGLITLPFNVQVQAAGKTPTQLQKEIRSAYVPSLFVNLTVTVKAQDRYVYVDGEVKVPNKIFHQDGLTVLRAISTVGGFTDFANKGNIEVRRAIGGKTEKVDWFKAINNPKLDLPLYVNDQIYVRRRKF